jgi:hypothetical protein
MSATLDVQYKGRKRTFATIRGGGTCGSCNILDVDADVSTAYPADDEEQRLRWADWGNCDYLLWEQGEAIVVTGSFGHGRSRAVLVSWIAPDGGKRPLCYLKTEREAAAKVVKAEDPGLCNAVLDGKEDSPPWEGPVSISGSSKQSRFSASAGLVAAMDLDLDGKPDLVARLEYDSGAGCGYHHEWLEHVAADEADPANEGTPPLSWKDFDLEDGGEAKLGGTYEIQDSPLSRLLALGTATFRCRDRGSLFRLKLLSYRGKPYVLGHGEAASAQVLSLWGGEPKTWCEYELLPVHSIDVFYPMESWVGGAR